ncbi:hypothetical protein [Dyadobacter sp. CY323]|uniref:hypothetical protein n=1 Tax=Dyadobacter sp. CY323 TaxID=2907302 RepID=UPI001F2F5CB2|nr:hypothetical protein [Dyadobacter sp. CY323]MCE6993117.1 hypothetical protein [Dyadobacter sp. CY323]
MKKSTLALLPILCLMLWACPKDADPKPDPDIKSNRVSLLEKEKDGIQLLFGSKNTSPYLDLTGFKNPECGVNSEFKNLKYTLADDIPNDNHSCGSKILEGYLTLNIGTSLVVDVSYYSDVKSISIRVVDGCTTGMTISLTDTDGKIIAKKVTSYSDENAAFRTRDGLDFSKIKEIRIFKTCEGGPSSINISPY